MGIYSSIATWYDRLFPVGEVQADFLLSRLNAMGASRVLDAGCGTGRHLEILADAGMEVLGLEPEADMARLAARRLAGRGEVLALPLESAGGLDCDPFDATLCLGNTLAHLLDEQVLARGLSALAASLRPGGILVVQTVHFEKVLREGRSPFEDKLFEDGLRFQRRYGFDRVPDLIDFTLDLSGPDLHFTDTFPLRPWSLLELEAALKHAGFAITEICGDWTGATRNEDSPATIIVARRVNSDEA